MVKITGKVIRGRRAANETITMQKRFFRALPDIDRMYNGTINLKIDSFEGAEINSKIYLFKDIEWHLNPSIKETFILISAKIKHSGRVYEGYLYFPSLSLHNQETNFVEVLSEEIEGLSPRDSIEIETL